MSSLTRGGRAAAALCISFFCVFLTPAAHAIVAGDPNPPKDASGNYLYPPDSPTTPYDPVTKTGRLDHLGLSSPFSGVGTIGVGTGTLIDATHVLTAAHLFASSDPTGVTFTLDSGAGMVSLAVSRIDICPGFNGTGTYDAYDLAVVTLSAPVPPTYLSYGLYSGPLTAGTTLTLVGYGESGDGVNGYNSSLPRGRRVGQNNADGYLLPGGQSVATTYQPGYQTYLFDFDGLPAGTPNYLGGGSLGNTVEATIGTGDSGSPAFTRVNGQYNIAATNNFYLQFDNGPMAGFFGSGGGGAIVSAYKTFLQSIVPSQFSQITVSGTVTLQGVAAGNMAQPLVFTLTPTGATADNAFSRGVTPAGNGSFTLTNVPAGTYTLGIKGSKWLRKDVSIDTTAGSVSGLSVPLLGGDINGDNAINGLDIAAISGAFRTQPGDARWNATCDINCDGVVNGLDISIASANFRKQGDP